MAKAPLSQLGLDTGAVEEELAQPGPRYHAKGGVPKPKRLLARRGGRKRKPSLPKLACLAKPEDSANG